MFTYATYENRQRNRLTPSESTTTHNRRIPQMFVKTSEKQLKQSAIRKLYKQFRESSPFMLVGRNAEVALSAAKTLAQFNRLEFEGCVRMQLEFDYDSDASFYDTWPHLSERSRRELKQAYCDDCYVVSSQIFNRDSHEWETVDSIGGCAGYKNPCSPFENCYVIDMMQSAIDRLDVSGNI